MKIEESTIDHNVTRLIDELMLWETLGEDMGETRIMILGYISGLHELAKALKEVLKA